jgi:hypothetical protein
MIEPPKPGRSGKNYRGPLETAKLLMAAKSRPAGLHWLKEHDALNLSVESLVVKTNYREFFSEDEQRVAKRRLAFVRNSN